MRNNKKILNYIITEKIDETANSVVYRGRRDSAGAASSETVIIKVLKIEHSTPSDIARFKQEYEIIKGLHFEGILETFDIIEYTEGMALVLEDFDGCSLKEIIGKEKTIDIRLFLEIAISVSEIVGTLHKNNIIHRDIKPHNILINGETKKIRLIDFGISSELTHEHEEIYSREVIEGTLAYMSPEQTGRMNRVVDYRTDIYSMGITFYEMLAGEVPFLSEDPLEIIHSHIAKRPVPLFSRESAIPEMISRIIMKQLSKTAEERYQNSFGLMADFRKCLDELDREGKIAPFDPGMKDISLKFSVSRKLVGRERESHRILAAFDRACTGSLLRVFSSEREIVLVTGGPGIGKSALVNSLQKSIAAKNAFFISGRYDRFRRDVPYSAILEAFRGVIRQILSESKEVINHWKESFTKVLGSGGGVITDVIPGMELIIGPQADLPPVSPEESQNRFIHIFKSFIRILATHEHPLVFFLDDLQWADSAGLQLLKSILSDSEIKSLFFIGAYRDNDAEEESTLQETIDAFAHDGGIITLIALSTLSVENINTLVSDSLRCDKKKSYSLAEMVHWKTNGNPSFVNQFMEILYRKGLLELCSEKGWQWDLDKIRRLQVTDNVVNLLAGRITQLEEKTIQALKVCACIGNRFDLEMLSSILNTPIEKVPGILREAILEGLIYMFDDVYFFQHERIREAAYSLLPEREKAEIHLKTGRVLLEKRGGFELREDIFDITDQLNFGASLLTDPEERYELALLNLMAGSQAKATGAFTAAYNYLKSGVALEEKESWKKQYNLTLALYKGLAEAAYLNGCYDEMETIAGNILEEIQTITDRIKIYEVRIRALIAQNRLIDAIETALPVFKLLGFRIPANPGKAHMLIAYLEIGLLLRGKNIDDLSALPDMKDPLKLAIPRLLLMVFPAFYIAKPNIVPVLVFKAISLLIKNGNSSEAPFVYSLYGFILCGALERIDEGYKFGKLALNLLEGKPNDSLRPRTLFVVNDFIRHWKEHPGDFQQSLLEGYRTGMKTGDLEFAGYSLFLEDYMLFMTGTELPVLEQNMRKNNLVLEQLNHAAPLCYARIFHQAVLNFMGFLHESWDLTGEAYNEKEMIQAHHDTKDRTALCNLYLCKLILSYVFRELPQSLENSRRCREYLDGSMGTLNNPVFYFFDSLVRLALCNRSNLRRARKNQVQMKKWASHAPMNHLHRYYLVEAEIARVSGNHTKAMDFYGKAISEAHKNKYIQDEALANECAARYYKGREAAGIAGLYFTRAHACYSRWGAAAKAKQLEARYPEYLFRGMKKVSTGMAVRSSTLSTTESISEALDLSTVVKASQAISGEIVLSRLLSRLMQLTLENAGAEKGCLLLEKEGKIFVEAEGEVGNSGVRVLESVPVELHRGLSSAMVNYVERTKEPLILADASGEGEYTHDPYVLEQKPKSILCMPIVRQGKLTGMLYLENDLISGAFTPERLEVLKVISSQVAISIDNARLYENLEQKNEKLIELDKLKDEFLANTSHELRTPLNGIIGIADSMLEHDDFDEKSGRDLSLIVSSGRRLANLVNDILDFSKLKNRDIGLNPVPLDIKSLTDVVIDLSRPLTRQKGLELVNAIDAGIPAVNGDENRLQQILFNLVGNSIKFTESGEVRITADILEAGNAKDRFIRITVSDTGIGIPPGKQDDVFKSFEQVDGSIARQYGGTGIGLSIVKQLVELHGGEVGLVSAEGAGSSFFFTIPAAEGKARQENISRSIEQASRVRDLSVEEAASAGEREGGKKSGRKGGRILAVDDDLVNLQVINNYLSTGDSTADYDLTLASGGIQALDLLKESDYDLVLLDIMMPGISGYEVCRVIREQFSLYELPVIILTARNTIPDLVAGFEAGANDYLTKPLTKSELLVRVNTLVTLKRTVAEHKEAKYKLLQDRMSPHFLFNALNTIHALMYRDVKTANSALLKLAHNYRFLMDQVLKSVIPFEEEWEFVKNYLELEELQFDDILSTEMTLDGDFDGVFIPPLTIQPILENCLKHGLKDNRGDGRVTVRAECRDHRVIVTVEDNGTGLEKEGEELYSRSLGNILQRLKYRSKEAAVTAENRDGGGTRVEINFRVWHE